MKKRIKTGYFILAILFALVSLIAFIIPTRKNSVFWIAYAFTIVAFALQYFIWRISIGKAKELKSKYLGFPLVYVAFVYLLVQIVTFAVFISLAKIVPIWVVVLACVLVLGLAAFCMIATEVGKEEVERVENKTKNKTTFLKNIQFEVEILASVETDSEVRKALLQLAEKIRYSDPMSSDELSSIENEIEDQVQQLKFSNNKLPLISSITQHIIERNSTCKILK